MPKKNNDQNKLYPSDKNLFLDIALHEAGHHVIAIVLGFESKYMCITVSPIQGNHQAGCSIDVDKELIQADSEYCKCRIKVLFAGALAQSMYETGIVNREQTLHSLATNALEDHEKIVELLRTIYHMKVHVSKDPYTDLLDDTEKIVKQYKALIFEIANALLSKLTHYDKQAFLYENQINTKARIQEIGDHE